MRTYKAILADPAWSYRTWKNQPSRTADSHYSVMSVEELAGLNVAKLADRDCLLFLWVTSPCLEEGLKVLRAWGFKYLTIAFVWNKLNKRAGSPFFGLGHYTRPGAEVCLLGKRGRPTIASRSVYQVISAPVGEHSAKPVETYERIEKLCGDCRRVELFARNTRPGWKSLGFAIDGFDLRNL